MSSLATDLSCLCKIFFFFVCRQRVRVRQWPDWPSSAIVLRAAVSGRSAAGAPGPRMSQILPPHENLHPREIYASGWGLCPGAHERRAACVTYTSSSFLSNYVLPTLHPFIHLTSTTLSVLVSYFLQM